MTIVLVLLGLIVVIGAALAVQLLRLGSAAPQSLQPADLQGEIPDPVAYGPMRRLFSSDDFLYVDSLRPPEGPMIARLRRQRRRAMSLYLRQIRKDFHRTWVLCHLLGPVNQNSHFGALLLRKYVAFHALYAVLSLRHLIGLDQQVQSEVLGLVSALERLRRSALQAVQAAESLAFQGAGSYGGAR